MPRASEGGQDMTGISRAITVARMHEVGGPLRIEPVPVPRPGSTDVLVRVRSCGIVPNLGNILANWTTWYPEMPLPPLPAIFGLDPAGEIAATGDRVHNLKPGDRVYVNPLRTCGACRHCRKGDPRSCRHAAFQGYFGFSEHALQTFRDYDTGGLGEYMVAPASAIVTLPETMSYDHAARLGYMGTAYSALKKARAGPTDTTLVNGLSGTLGIGCLGFGLAMGVKTILGTARNRELLWECKALAPHRIEVHSIDDGPIDEWARGFTENGEGVDAFIDCNGPGATQESFLQGMRALRRGGRRERRRARRRRAARRPFHDGQQPVVHRLAMVHHRGGPGDGRHGGLRRRRFLLPRNPRRAARARQRGDLGHRQAAWRVLQLRHPPVRRDPARLPRGTGIGQLHRGTSLRRGTQGATP